MLEVMQFVFSSFWVWSGTVILLAVASHGLYLALLALRGNKAE